MNLLSKVNSLVALFFFLTFWTIQNAYPNEAEEDGFDTSESAEISPTQNDKIITEPNLGTTNVQEVQGMLYGRKATIIAINKITAKSEELALKVGESRYFGNISIKIHQCLHDRNLYLPEHKALLTILENKIDEESILFQGWMFSSSVSLSTFEHPIYEVFVKSCALD